MSTTKRAARPVNPKNTKKIQEKSLTANVPTPSSVQVTPQTVSEPQNTIENHQPPSNPTENTNGLLAADHTNVQPAAATETQDGPTPQKVRVQTNKTIGICISAARVRRHIDKLNLNEKIENAISEIKEKTNAHKLAQEQLKTQKIKKRITKTVGEKEVSEDVLVDITPEEATRAQAIVDQYGPQINDLNARSNALSRERTRFSNEAPIVLAIICDELIQQLIDFSMKQVLLMRKKIVQISHLHRPNIETLSLYPLIKSLPLFVKTAEKLAKEEKVEADEEYLKCVLKQAEKDFKKKYAEYLPKKKKGTVAPTAPADTDATPETTNGAQAVTDEVIQDIIVNKVHVDDDDENSIEDDLAGDSKTSFKYYVHQICKEVMKSDIKYTAIRTSPLFREYLSDLLVEFIQRICPLILLTAGSMKNKTINDVAILRTVENILIDGHKHVESIDLKIELVPNPDILKELLDKKDAAKKVIEEAFKVDGDIAKKEAKLKEVGAEYANALLTVPKVDGWVAHRKITYPSSGFTALNSKVEQKMLTYASLTPKKDKPAATPEVKADN